MNWAAFFIGCAFAFVFFAIGLVAFWFWRELDTYERKRAVVIAAGIVVVGAIVGLVAA